MTSLGISCPIHGIQAAPAPTVLIARRSRPSTVPGTKAVALSWAVTAPCPADRSSVVVLLPAVDAGSGVSMALVTRLNVHGARLVEVTADSPATDIVPIALPGGAA
jgi:hypothetical protein